MPQRDTWGYELFILVKSCNYETPYWLHLLQNRWLLVTIQFCNERYINVYCYKAVFNGKHLIVLSDEAQCTMNSFLLKIHLSPLLIFSARGESSTPPVLLLRDFFQSSIAWPRAVRMGNRMGKLFLHLALFWLTKTMMKSSLIYLKEQGECSLMWRIQALQFPEGMGCLYSIYFFLAHFYPNYYAWFWTLIFSNYSYVNEQIKAFTPFFLRNWSDPNSQIGSGTILLKKMLGRWRFFQRGGLWQLERVGCLHCLLHLHQISRHAEEKLEGCWYTLYERGAPIEPEVPGQVWRYQPE